MWPNSSTFGGYKSSHPGLIASETFGEGASPLRLSSRPPHPLPPPLTMQARPLSATRTVWSRTPGVVALLYPSVAAHKLSNSPLLFSRAFTSHDSGRSGHDGSWGGGRSSWWGAWSSTGWAVALVGGASQVALCDGKDEVHPHIHQLSRMQCWGGNMPKSGWGNLDVCTRLPLSKRECKLDRVI